MPIRPENKSRYPADWPQISERVRNEAGQKCEWCKAPNGTVIRRAVTSVDGLHVYRHDDWTAHMDGLSADDGETVPGTCWDEQDWGKPVKVVLAVAHMDHQPENCARENLKALCQRCHNKYDAPMRRAGISERAKGKMAVGDLFEGHEGAK